ncbi:hypothetical protein CRE_21956 [Caenorhabditis remanei]|uniref:Uncharacterized protein n=1 Tax=Caenorhabditis remanei TaxID=31234 RepID=E3MUI8_CAERE|nr:hypothetical protein CRE_21956 [Caenorhabditis remanei]
MTITYRKHKKQKPESTRAKKEKESGVLKETEKTDKNSAKTPAKAPVRTPADIKRRLSLYRSMYGKQHEGETDEDYLRRVEELPDDEMSERPKATPKRHNVRPVFDDSPPRQKKPTTSVQESSSTVPKGQGEKWSVSEALAQLGYSTTSSKTVVQAIDHVGGSKKLEALKAPTQLAQTQILHRHTAIDKPIPNAAQATNGHNVGPKNVEKLVMPQMDETPILPRQAQPSIRPAHMSRKEVFERRSKSSEEEEAIQRNPTVSLGAPSTSNQTPLRSRTEVQLPPTNLLSEADYDSLEQFLGALRNAEFGEDPMERAKALLTPHARALAGYSAQPAAKKSAAPVGEEAVEASKPRRSSRMVTPRYNLNKDDFGEGDSDEDYVDEDAEEEKKRKKAEEKHLAKLKKDAIQLLKNEERRERRRVKKEIREQAKRDQRQVEKAMKKKRREDLKAQDQARIDQEKEAERTRKKNIKDAEDKKRKEAAAIRKLQSFFSKRNTTAGENVKAIQRLAKRQARQARADKKQAVPSFNSKERASRSFSADGRRKDLEDVTAVTATPPKWLYWTMLRDAKKIMRSNYGKVAKFAMDTSNLVEEHYLSFLPDPFAKAAALRFDWAKETNWGSGELTKSIGQLITFCFSAPDADYCLNLSPEELYAGYGTAFTPLDQSNKASSYSGLKVTKSDHILKFAQFLKMFPLRKMELKVVKEINLTKRIPSLEYFVEKFIFLFKVWKISNKDTPYPRVYHYFLHVVSNIMDIKIGRLEYNDSIPEDEETRFNLVRDLLFWLPLHIGDLTDKIHSPRECFVGLARQLLAVLVDEWIVECAEVHEEELQVLFRLQLAALRLECYDVFNEETPVDPAPFFRPAASQNGFIAGWIDQQRPKMSVIEAMRLPKESMKRKLRRRHQSFSEFKDIVETVEPIQVRRAPRFFDPDPTSYFNSVRGQEF